MNRKIRLRPLLRRTPLLSGESLGSLVTRLANLNHYANPSVIYQLCKEPNSRDTMYLPRKAETFERMSSLFQVEPAALHAATPHRFASLFSPVGSDLQYISLSDGASVPVLPIAQVKSNIFTSSYTQYCQRCLQEEAYHRLVWLTPALSVCTKHNCFLNVYCPGCGVPTTIYDVCQTRCYRCNTSLISHDTSQTPDDGLNLATQRVVESWLLGTPEPPFHYALPDESPQVLFQLYQDFCLARAWSDTHWLLEKRAGRINNIVNTHVRQNSIKLAPQQRLHLSTEAFKALLNWPEEFLFGFLPFLDKYDAIYRSSGETIARPEIAFLFWLKNRWNHRAFDFVHEALELYMDDFRRREFARTSPLRQLSQSDAPLHAREVERLLVVSPISRLVKDGILEAVSGPEINRRQSLLIKRASVVKLRTVLERRVRWAEEYRGPAHALIDLRMAMAKLNRIGLEFPDLLERIHNGQLNIFVPAECISWGIQDLLFDEEELRERMVEVVVEEWWSGGKPK